MMKKHEYLILLLLPVGALLKGQDTTRPAVKCTGITELSVQAGWLSGSFSPVDLDGFRQLTPQSELLKNDFSGYSSEYYSWGNAFTFSILAGIRPSGKNYLLRMGIGYYAGDSFSGTLTQSNSNRYDTLISSATGHIYFLDSLISDSYYVDYFFRQLRIDGSLLFGSNPEARWQLYTGLGFTAGVSFDARTNVDYRNEWHASGVYNPADGIISDAYPIKSTRMEEFHQNKMNYSVAAYVPLGIDFRIGNAGKTNILRQMHLFYECRPSVHTLTLPETGNTSASADLQHGFGLKVAW